MTQNDRDQRTVGNFPSVPICHKAMKYGTTLMLTSFILLAPSPDFAATGEPGRPTVRGIVTDPLNSRIAGASVLFVKPGQEKVAVTENDGSYEISIDPGTYALSVRAAGFCLGHRSGIILRKHSQARIDFQLVECGIIDSIQPPQPNGRQQSLIRPPGPDGNGYGEESLNPVPPTGLHPFILFGHREEKGDRLVYIGLERKKSSLPAVFTFNLTTIKANTIVYDARNKSVEGLGEVSWQDGEHIWHGKRIDLVISGDSPRVVLKE
jgi:carboxypeptidase family protein